MKLALIEEGEELLHFYRRSADNTVVSTVQVVGFSKGSGYPIVLFDDGTRIMVDPAQLERPGKDRIRYTVLGVDSVDKTVAARGTSGGVYVPPSWIGSRVKIIKME